jgi:hypothetical protein
LNNKRLEAAKRAAIITTALQWLLGRVPLTVVPPQFRAGVLVAQRLVPYLGYIGGFVAWSWGAMRSFDKGARDRQFSQKSILICCRSRDCLDGDLASTCRSHSWDLGSEGSSAPSLSRGCCDRPLYLMHECMNSQRLIQIRHPWGHHIRCSFDFFTLHATRPIVMNAHESKRWAIVFQLFSIIVPGTLYLYTTYQIGHP